MPTSSWTVGKGGACVCAQPWAWSWVRRCRRNFPGQFLHYNRAGHGAVISPQTQWGYTVFVRTKISRIIGDSGIHVGTMSFGKVEGEDSDKNIAFMLQVDEADGPYYHQYWEGMKQTTPIISGGVCALRLQAFFENLGRSNAILTAGGGTFGRKDGPKQSATSCRQGEESWKVWKAGAYGDVSLSDGVIEYARTYEEIKGAFFTIQKDADQIYPGWKERESPVQAASFNWKKKAASAAFVGASLVASRKEQLEFTGESSMQAASFDWKKKVASAAFAGASLAASPKGSAVTREALDQSTTTKTKTTRNKNNRDRTFYALVRNCG